jgi:hypothetical protein
MPHSEEIGLSREGQPLYGIKFGTGSQHISVIAGCHADEPAGRITARSLLHRLTEHFPDLLDEFTFYVIPDMNPDGAARNQCWFTDPPKVEAYLQGAVRELPGDDVEFGFGNDPDARPECQAAMAFLKEAAPFAAHFSLHSMGFAEGAWFLICREWAERISPLMDRLTAFCSAQHWPLYDIDRKGEKGFTRIRKGFCTTPGSDAMRDFFLAQDDPAMAALFRPNSMEFIRSLGGDPICAVSELPEFRVGRSNNNLERPSTTIVYESLKAWRARQKPPEDPAMATLAQDYQIQPVPFHEQTQLQYALILGILEDLRTTT